MSRYSPDHMPFDQGRFDRWIKLADSEFRGLETLLPGDTPKKVVRFLTTLIKVNLCDPHH